MEFREFIGKTLGDLVGENKTRPVGTIDSDRYKNLSKEKSKIEALQNLTINVKEVVKSRKELLDIAKKVFELDSVVDSEKISFAELIESNLFTIISNLNVDLELADAGSSEEEVILQSLGVAYYIYEEFLYPIITTKPKETLQTPDEWVDIQKKELIKIKASLKSDLEIAGLLDLDKTGKNLKVLSASERSAYGPRWTSAIQPLLSKANEQVDNYPTEIIYSNWKKELTRVFKEVIKDWNLEEIKQKRKEDVDLMSLKEIVEEVINLEIPYWDSSYSSQENDEYKAALAERIRWRNFDKEKGEWVGLGWEDYAVLTGQASNPDDERFEQTFNSLERRELVVKLQVAALEALQLRRNGFAEGDRSKLFENLIKTKMNREQLLLATTCHPRYGAYITKILKIAQELPILRKGSLPKEATTATGFPIKFVIKGKEYELKRKNALNDRVVIRKSKDGFLPVLLRGDISWETRDPNNETIILDKGFIPAEESLADDKLLYEFNENYSYDTLASDTGRPTRDRMIQDIMKMLDDDPKRFGLSEEDIPNEDDKNKAKWFAGKLFYSFPFLSYILAKRKETTQTDSHNTDLEEDINWMLVFSPLGHAIHSSQRYGAANVAWMWLLPYYPELKQGHYGASGDADRLNKLRALMIKHQECFFDTKEFSGQVFKKKQREKDGRETNGDVLLPPFGASEFLSPLDIITPSPQERIALRGNGVGKRGQKIVANPREPVYLGFGGRIDATKTSTPKERGDAKKANDNLRSFDLCKTAIDGWLSFLKKTLEDMSKELEDGEIVEGVGEKKAILGQLMGDCLGKAKMFFTDKEEWKGTELEDFDHLYGVARPILWHLIERTFYAYGYGDIHSRRALFAKALEAVAHDMTKGGLSSGSAQAMAAWIYQIMKGTDDHIRYGAKNGFEGMNVSLAPPSENSWGNRRHKVFEYLQDLWEWKRQTAEVGAEVFGEFPLLNDLGMLKPHILIAQRSNPVPHIAHFQAMMKKEEDLERPVTRSGLKTSSSKEDKE